MSRSIRLALGAATLAALTFALSPLVGAAPEPARPIDPQWKQLRTIDPPELTFPPPPKPLTRLQLSESLTKAAKRASMPTIANAPQTLEMRVTPANPRLENGARIVEARSINLVTPTTDVPDGVYWLTADWGYSPRSLIKIRVPTEKVKLYVADRRRAHLLLRLIAADEQREHHHFHARAVGRHRSDDSGPRSSPPRLSSPLIRGRPELARGKRRESPRTCAPRRAAPSPPRLRRRVQRPSFRAYRWRRPRLDLDAIVRYDDLAHVRRRTPTGRRCSDCLGNGRPAEICLLRDRARC